MVVAVADTNVLVSAFINPAGTPGLVLAAVKNDRFELALSEYIIDELQTVLGRPYFVTRVSSTEQQAGIALLRSLATIVVPDPSVRGVSRDANDDPVLDTAVAANAAYLVTGDADLLALEQHGSVAIVAPRPFLTLLDRDSNAVADSETAADG